MEKIILDNNMTLYTKKLENVNTIGFSFIVKIGSAFENKEQRGISHLLEHMLFKSNEKYSAEEITKKIELLGGQTNAFTTKNKTVFYFETIKENFEKILDIFYHMFNVKKFKEEEFQKEKEVVLSELKISKNNPSHYIYQLQQLSVYGESDWGEDIGGKEETVKNIEKEDLEKFKEKYYQPDNVYLFLVGNFDEKIIEIIQKKFGKIEGKSKKKKEPTKENSRDLILKRNFLSNFRENCYVAFSYKLKSNFRLVDLWVMNVLLKGGMSSPFFQEIREKRGLCYSITTLLDIKEKKSLGEYSIFLDSIKERYVEKSKNIITKILEKIKNKNIGKKYREGRICYYKLLLSELERNLLSLIETYSFYLGIDYEIDILERLKKLLSNFERYYKEFEYPLKEKTIKTVYKV